jgi:hypothetical protein
MTELLSPDSLELLENALANLIADQTVYISDIDFKKLTGDEITEFGSEGRLMMGNLAAATNCTIDTTGRDGDLYQKAGTADGRSVDFAQQTESERRSVGARHAFGVTR